ncbi:TetR/AcrR family transcriptional regulator [Kribbella solani]|uniref:TetR/AcrR family transcriptional regulator n=1 Tax=Kribbella solani TaxID=236067 RepID=UPI0029A0CE7B|nr:TetR/AcrR family transcriptional regulator [Kribbella solani]MDX2972432.1 TetR/AcrR family transcriptional regulator [Kribbella solani]MDX3004118.1 TetR/AcrR family transcriptional regulator [Kribbella solani]
MQHPTGSRDTKGDIHRAAVQLFSTQGYEKTSLREIAEQVGITKASLYYHYSSKQDLLRAIIGTFLDEIFAVLSSVETIPWSPEAEQDALRAYVDVVVAHRSTGPTLLRDITAVLAAFGEDLDELIAQSRRFQLWLAGPDPTAADRLRAAAAVETVGAAISADVDLQASPDEVRAVLLEAATAVLGHRGQPPPT